VLNLYTISTKRENSLEDLSNSERISVVYHDLFDYPLSFSDLIRWQAGKKLIDIENTAEVTSKNGYYHLEGREGLIYKRLLRKRISLKKMKIAKNASRILAFLPGVKMVAVTGSLAMENSSEGSDIDLLIVTRSGSLWTTRLISYFALKVMNYAIRSPKGKEQKDKLCLNMWMDESDLLWLKKDRNLYTAHEIAQIIPLINKDKTYEKFILKNKWVQDFWPNSIRVNKGDRVRNKNNVHFSLFDFPLQVIEKLAFQFQYWYMKLKITREVVTRTRALFHPQDWGKVVLGRLSS
jgi:predicted nucleotidyltransferase